MTSISERMDPRARLGQLLVLTATPTRAIAQLRACRPIPEAQVREICHKARELLIEEGNVVTVCAPVTVRHASLRKLSPRR